MITIDGSQGEGGGQVLRTSLALSLASGEPFCIEKIRAGRNKPGLLRQHLTSVKAAVAIGCAEADGAELGSLQLTFRPKALTPGEYTFSVGTAGSTTLVLQTVLPPLLTASGPSTIVLEGGTHNPMAPPFEFIERAYLPLLRRMDARIEATLERPGFYPAGGGRMSVIIDPVASLTPIELHTRGAIRRSSARAVVANLSRRIAEREIAVIQQRLGFEADQLEVDVIDDGRGPGNVVLLEIEGEHVTEVITGFGERNVSAEAVAGHVVEDARRYLTASAPVGRHLADQLLVTMALAGGGSFRTLAPTRHTMTNIEVIQQFAGVQITTTRESKDDVLIDIASR